MRIGEILIAASLVDARKLELALHYASTKSIPVGGALRALKYVDEADLKRSLDAQQAIRQGLDPMLAVEIIRAAHDSNRQFVHELKHKQNELGKERISDQLVYWLNAPDSLEETRAGAGRTMQQQLVARAPEKLILQGDQFFGANQLLEAELAYVQARNNLEDQYFKPKEQIVVVLTKLANLYLAMNRFDEAHELYAKVLEMQSDLKGVDSPDVAHALEDLADLYMLEQRKADAEALYSKALDILEKLPEETALASRVLEKFGSAFTGANKLDGSRIGELAIAAGLLTEHQVTSALNAAKTSEQPVGMVLRNQGFLDGVQVESLMFAQLLVKQGSLTAPSVVRALKMSALHNVPLKQLADAGKWVNEQTSNDPAYKQLLDEQERLLTTEGALGPDDPEIAALAQKVAELHLARKDRVAAEPLFRRAVAILEKASADDADKSQLIRVYERLAQVQYQLNKLDAAQQAMLKSLQLRRADGRPDTLDTAKCLWLLGKLAVSQQKRADALAFLNGAKKIFDTLAPGQTPPQLIAELNTLNG